MDDTWRERGDRLASETATDINGSVALRVALSTLVTGRAGGLTQTKHLVWSRSIQHVALLQKLVPHLSLFAGRFASTKEAPRTTMYISDVTSPTT